MKLSEFITMHPNDLFYFVVEMPVNSEGQGPVSLQEAATIQYGVWDRYFQEHHSFGNLPEAIHKCNQMNYEDWKDYYMTERNDYEHVKKILLEDLEGVDSLLQHGELAIARSLLRLVINTLKRDQYLDVVLDEDDSE